MMFSDASGRPRPDRIQAYLQLISNSMDMAKKDRDYIIALEKQILEDRKNQEREALRKRRLIEHQRVQTLLDKGVVKPRDLMRQEVKDFKLLHNEVEENKVQLARCPSPSPVKETPVFLKKKSVFLTDDYVRRVLANDFKRVVVQIDSKEDDTSDQEFEYSDSILKEMSKATKVEELYSMAQKLVFQTEEGCKDVQASLNQ